MTGFLEGPPRSEAEFERLVAQHPDEDAALRQAWEDWKRAESSLESHPRPGNVLRPGDRLGEFLLVRRLGHGGQASVWEAEQPRLRRSLALKILRADRESHRDLQLFQREGYAGARLRHEAIVTVFDVGETEGRPWIAQELVPNGRSVRDRIDEVRVAGSASAGWYEEVARMARDTARALVAAHNAGVLHRDVKPQNLMLLPGGRVKVADFGLARIEDATVLTETGQLVGTYHYMSPEQVTAKHSEIDHQTDVFALGVVLYEMLTLARPFEGDTPHQICTRILQDDPVDPRALRSHVPAELSVICLCALEKRRARRYPDMAAFADDLERFLRHEPIRARAATNLDRTVRWTRRHPIRALLAAMAAMLVALGIAWATERDGAAKRSGEVLRLALGRDLVNLVESADAMWPPRPELAGEMEDWIARASEVHAQLPDLRRSRDDVRSSMKRGVFESSREAQWWLTELDRLIAAIEALGARTAGLLATDGFDPAHGWSIPRRLRFARAWHEGMEPGGEYAVAWTRALPSLREVYPRIEWAPQFGLVPLEIDPHSGLWEFWHVQSGARPERDPETGRWRIEDETGVVLVLVPGARAWIGAQAEDASAPHYDAAADANEQMIEVDLDAFFLSKYELTRAQWRRAMPDTAGPTDGTTANATDPIGSVSWNAATEGVRRLGLRLPTEAQWEYGARGGTTSPWWTGAEPASVAQVNGGNLADRSYGASESEAEFVRAFEDWNDEYPGFAPPGMFAPNPFGLHDTIGNSSEWCRDPYVSNPELRAGDGLAISPTATGDVQPPRSGGTYHSRRGGNFYWGARVARVSRRARGHADYFDLTVGLRPARPFDLEEAQR